MDYNIIITLVTFLINNNQTFFSLDFHNNYIIIMECKIIIVDIFLGDT